MVSFNLIEKSRVSYLVFMGGEFFGECEMIADDWVFLPRAGLPGERYAYGSYPVDAVQQWCERNMKGGRLGG